MKRLFRERAPRRTYEGPEKSAYRQYKVLLREDFNRRCGYVDCEDFWFGGVTVFTIDHFRPKSIYPELTTRYGNLIYCSPFVNRAKSNDFDDKHYLDPCEVDYNRYFERDDKGNILVKECPEVDENGQPLSPEEKGRYEAAAYMYKKMKFYLKRYGVIWMLTNLQGKLAEVNKRIEHVQNEAKKQKLLMLHYQLSTAFQEYLHYLALDR